MARYNSVNSTSSVAQGSTISTPYSGLLTTITTGSGSIALPNPTLYTGSSQTFYNSTVAAVTLTTPSGVFNGPGAGGTSSLTLPVNSIITLVSDGTNYIAQDWLGGAIAPTTIIASGTITANSAVAFNPSNANISIQPTGTGTVTINPATIGSISNMSASLSTLSTTGNASLTAATSVTLGTAASGALQVTNGGVGVAGGISVGGVSYFGANVGIGSSAFTATYPLHVNNTAGNPAAFVSTASGGGNIRLECTNAGTTVLGYVGANAYSNNVFGLGSSGSVPVVFYTNASEAGRFDTNQYLLLGYGSSTGSYKLQVNGNFYVSGLITEASSIALKENVQPIENALNLVLDLMGVTYDRRDGSKKNEPGLIAEEVYKRAPSLVSLDKDGKPAGVMYTKLGPYLIEAIRILNNEVIELKSKKSFVTKIFNMLRGKK